ncbi:hypothetical protein ACFQ1E_10350 [Sphingomonas canadensis]|uniref:Uncharacterized protein n=1 Tax=Sphingomonas canadensis TaxID=1219257 RepID=A0ABW3H5L7_9SPHN|nr:hypothetical protein [Sphingomonas canadensis]MCW3836481.1 hypothetical protein [Sphingomonas canadensis]
MIRILLVALAFAAVAGQLGGVTGGGTTVRIDAAAAQALARGAPVVLVPVPVPVRSQPAARLFDR